MLREICALVTLLWVEFRSRRLCMKSSFVLVLISSSVSSWLVFMSRVSPRFVSSLGLSKFAGFRTASMMKPCLFYSLDSFVSFRAAYPLVWDQQVLWETCTLNTLLWDDFASFPVREIPFRPGTRFYRFYSFSLLESSFISFIVISGYFSTVFSYCVFCQRSCCILVWPISFTPFGTYASL